MEEDYDKKKYASKLFDLDSLCYDKCVSNPAKKLSTREENCLQQCNTKMLNALDFMHEFDEKGGVGRK